MHHMERVGRVRAMLRQVSPGDDLESVPIPAPEQVSAEESLGPSDPARTVRGIRFGYQDAVEGVRKLREQRDSEISPAELLGVEAIVLAHDRPAVFVRAGTYDQVGGIWSELDTAAVRARIDPQLGAIGRIELPFMPSVPYGGTGFLVGPSLLMTNRHVARLFAEGRGTKRLVYRPGDALVDFECEYGSLPENASHFSIEQVLMIHPYWDMALVRVSGLSTAFRPLTLSVRAPEDLVARDMVAIGYPARDARNDLALQDRIFGGVYDVKRLQPGKIRPRSRVHSFENEVEAMVHDSSTLGGNSGSAVIDVGSGRVVGLHFAGEYLKANYAVPSYELARDRRVVDAGVQFDGRVAATEQWQRAWVEADGFEVPERAAGTVQADAGVPSAAPPQLQAPPQVPPQPQAPVAAAPQPQVDAGVIQIPITLRIAIDLRAAGAEGGAMGGPAARAALAGSPAPAAATGRRLSMRELQDMMRDPDIDEAQLRPYFVFDPSVSRAFAPGVIPNPALVDVAQPLDVVEGAMLMSWASSLSRFRRQEQFKARLARGDRRPVLVSEGDSWFQFPVLLADVIDNLQDDFNVWSVDAAGDTLQNMVHDHAEYLAALRRNAGKARAFLFSGGGNDIIGEDARGVPVIGQILRRFEEGRPAEWYLDTPAVEEKFRFVEECLRRVFGNVAREFPGLPVLCHGYDYAIPGGAPGDTRRPGWAAVDKWLGKPMREMLGIQDHALQREIVRVLIDRFNLLQQRLCGGGDPAAAFPNAWHVDLRRRVEGRWADELHPTDDGFGAVAAQVKLRLREVLDRGPQALRAPAAPGMPDQERTPNLDDDAEASRMLALAEGAGLAEAAADWRVAKGLMALRDKINALAPRRSRASDGTIGDARHRTRSSDHNPWVEDGGLGVVTAIDITDDPGNGCSADKLARSLQAARDPRVKYVIWNRRIMNAGAIDGAAPWEWRSYGGVNPHKAHLHLSIKPDKASYDSTADWQVTV
ncbi:trypsin-like serine peptidase [Massilia sp. SYSU DXS3249]